LTTSVLPEAETAAVAAFAALTLALRRGDLAAAASCFALDACLRTPDATAIHGRSGIRETLAQLIAMNVEVDAELDSIVLAGGVALGLGRWRTRAADPDGCLVEQVSRLTVVLRPIEGAWKIAITLPWG
jgi:ketosteroid isomerase-like protein